MKIKRKILSGLLCAIVFCFMVPCIVSAEGEDDSSPLNVVNGTLNGTLDLTNPNVLHENLDSDGNGYIWDPDSGILTLKNVCIEGTETSTNNTTIAVKVPAGKKITINTEGSSTLKGDIVPETQIYQPPLDLIFKGTALLTIHGQINCGVNGDCVVVQDGANVVVTEISLGGSGGADGSISVTGSGSTLTITEETIIAKLMVIDGGTLFASNIINIRSIPYADGTWTLGDITMDSSSKIEINAIPTLVSTATMDSEDAILCDALKKIKDYLPEGYQIGFGEDENGNKYCTILDSDGNIASNLTLKEQPPKETTPSEDTPSSSAPKPTSPNNPPSSENPPEDSDNNSNSQSQNTGINAGSSSENPANSSQSGAAFTSPRTGDYETTGIWFFYVLGSVVVLCLLAGRYKTRKN